MTLIIPAMPDFSTLPELDEAVDLHVDRVEVAALGGRLDGDGVAHVDGVEPHARAPAPRRRARTSRRSPRRWSGRAAPAAPPAPRRPAPPAPGAAARPTSSALTGSSWSRISLVPDPFSFTQRCSSSSLAILLPRARRSLIWSRRRAFLSLSHSSAYCLPTRMPRWPRGIIWPSAICGQREGLEEGVHVGADVAQEGEGVVEGELGDPVLEELQLGVPVPVEARPELVRGGAGQVGPLRPALGRVAALQVGDDAGVGEVLLEQLHDPPDVRQVGPVGAPPAPGPSPPPRAGARRRGAAPARCR